MKVTRTTTTTSQTEEVGARVLQAPARMLERTRHRWSVNVGVVHHRRRHYSRVVVVVVVVDAAAGEVEVAVIESVVSLNAWVRVERLVKEATWMMGDRLRSTAVRAARAPR